jgi:hypothetical protein
LQDEITHGAAPCEAAHRMNSLQRDVDCNRDGRVPVVKQVIAVINIADINVVGIVPVIRPVFRPRVYEAEPITLILEAGKSAHYEEGTPVDSEGVRRPKVPTEPIVRNAVTVIAATLLPSAVV